jgi:hypothetical protein
VPAEEAAAARRAGGKGEGDNDGYGAVGGGSDWNYGSSSGVEQLLLDPGSGRSGGGRGGKAAAAGSIQHDAYA